MTNVLIAYCATRTLTNTLETNLTCIALYYYPWNVREVGKIYSFRNLRVCCKFTGNSIQIGCVSSEI